MHLAHWEADVARLERETNAQLLDTIKIGILRSRTSGALQQHLGLSASRAAAFAGVRAVLLGCF